MNTRALRLFVAVFALSFSPRLLAGDHTVDPSPAPPAARPFDKGTIDFSVLAGAYWSFELDSSDRPSLDIAWTNVRVGVMLGDVSGDGWARGNAELLFEGLYGAVIDGPGSWAGGGGLLLRYNFVQPDAKCVPYCQIGVGALWNDVHQDENQTLIGKSVEFNLTAAVGIRYQFAPQWAFNAEAGYRHISNANTSSRNTGLDSLGASVGLIYTF